MGTTNCRAEHMGLDRFVQLFIRKERRDRLVYELTNPEKQLAGLNRFCHQAKELLDPRMIYMEGEDLERRVEFQRFLDKRDELCFVLSADFYLDEMLLPPKGAVKQAVSCFDAVLIIGSDFAIVFGEVMKGGRGKYLLFTESK